MELLRTVIVGNITVGIYLTIFAGAMVGVYLSEAIHRAIRKARKG